MARKRKKEITPQTLREILRLGLKHKLGYREISRSCGVTHVTVGNYLKQVENTDTTWDEIESFNESQLKELVQGAHGMGSKRLRLESN